MSSMEKKIKEQLNKLPDILYDLRMTTLKENGEPRTQGEVADILGITYQSYQAYEHGKTCPTLQNFLKLAELYDISLDYLVGKKDI